MNEWIVYEARAWAREYVHYIKSRLKQNGRESGLQKHSKICGYKNLRNYEGLIAKMKEKNVKY